MFYCGYGNQLEPLYQCFDQFVIFFVWVVILVTLGLYGPVLGVFWGPKTLESAPMELNFLEYALLWVREQKRAFVLDFWAICNFCPMGGHFLPFWSYAPPLHPPHIPNRINKLRFVANPFASSSSEVTSRKPDLDEEFGSFLFFVFSISWNCGLFGANSGLF